MGTGGIFVASGALTQSAGSVIPAQNLTISGSTAGGASTVNLSSSLSIANSVSTLNSNVITVPSTNGIAVGQLVTGTGIPANEFVTAVNPANNTVTITTGTNVTAGTNTLAFLVNNTLNTVTFNNTGGQTNPTLNVTGQLNLPTATITASSSNPVSTNTIAGGALDLGNAAAPTITVNPISFNGQNIAPLQPTLNISSAFQNSNNPILVTGGGNLQLSSATSTFTGGVNVAAGTSLTLGASSTNNANGQALTGPLGIGTLTIGAGSTLLHDGTSRSVGNNVVVGGNFTFDAPNNTAASLTLGGGVTTLALPAAAATTITVNAPNMTGVLGGSVTGAGSSIVKAGLGTLQLNNGIGGQSTFNGGVTLNAGTLIASGVGSTGTSLGTGTVTINGGQLAFRHSGQTNNSVIGFGNNVLINGGLTSAYIDVNNNGANTGNTILLGNLDYTGFTGGNPAPTTVLNVTGGNNYKLQFATTTLGGATTSPTFNIASGLTLILPGGFTIGTNLPTNIGAGSLVYSGSNIGAATNISGTVAIAPPITQTSTPLGSGPITLTSGSTLQIQPIYASTISNAGYTAGGFTGKSYQTGAATIANSINLGIAPGSQLLGVQPNDSLMRQFPTGVNIATLTNTLLVYQGLLSVTTGGTYYFGGGTDDQLQISVDGQIVQNDLGAGHALNQQGLQSITLGSGQHSIVVRALNGGGGGSVNVFYGGPDTGANGITGTPPVSNLQALPLGLTSYATNYTNTNNYQNAAIVGNAITVAAIATIDGLGSDFNSAIPSLTLSAGANLTVANGSGAAGSIGNGAFIVTGVTDVSAGTATLTPTTGTLVLAGGVADGGLGLTKAGQGTLALGASSNFTGALNITGGFVQLLNPAGLTSGITTIGVATTTPATLDLNGQVVTSTGTIVLNGGAGPAIRSSNAGAGLYNSSAATASFGGNLNIGAATATVNASVGGFGDIILNGTVQDGVAGSAWNKVGPDFLFLNGTNTFTGSLNVNGGRVVVGNASALGTTGGSTIVAGGATLDLNGFSVIENITVNGGGQTGIGAANALGALINTSASPVTVSGTITLGSAASIGSSNLSGPVAGGITLSGVGAGAFAITKVGSNSLTFTNATANAATFIDVQSGSVTFSGGALLASSNNANVIRPGTTYTLDNSGTAISNRLGNHGIWLTGNFNISGNGAIAVSEIVNQGSNNLNLGTTFGQGYGSPTITLSTASTAGVTLQVASTSTSIFARPAGTTGLLRGDNLGQNVTGTANTANILGNATSLGLSTNNAQAVGQAGVWNAPNALIYPWAVADTSASGLGQGFAGYNGYTAGGPSAGGAMGGTTGALQANVFGISPINTNVNNIIATPAISTIASANTTNANATITVPSTATLQVGQLIAGNGIPTNAVITAIVSPTQFTISANATATTNTALTLYPNPTTTVAGVTTTASTTVTVPSTANLYAGEMVAGVTGTGTASGFITNGTTIASITNGTTIVLSAAATAGTGNLVFGLPGYANVSMAANGSFGVGSTPQLVNSLTMNNPGGSVTATINGGLQLDSGGVLAVGTDNIGAPTAYTINGPGILTGGNTLNREMIFHTVGASTTLTVNTPIFANGSGLTKADGGTLVLATGETYTGDTVINGGTLKLAGGNNTIFKVFTTAPTPGNATAAINGQNLTVDFGGTLDLNGNSQAVGNLRSGSAIQLSGGTVLNSTGTATFHVTLNASQTWAGNISNAGAGTLNFVRDGNNTLTVNSPNTFGGTATVTGGATTLIDLGTFENASAINVVRSALIWNDTGIQAVSNRLSPTAPITLTGGGFQFNSRSGTGATPVDSISLGTLNLGVGASSITFPNLAQGAASQITFAGIGTRAVGSALSIGSAVNAIGDNPRVFFTAAPALTNGLIGAWATGNGLVSSTGGTNAGFLTYDPASGVRILQYQPTATYGSGVNTILNGNATLPAPANIATTTTVNSLSIYAATTLSFTNPSDTLLIQSGGLLAGTDANGRTIGSTAIPGQIQSGAGNDLYIHNGNNTITINAKIVDNGSNNNVIIDGLSLANAQTVTLANANTYGGKTYLSGTQLSLNSPNGPAIPGDLIISGGNNTAADSLVDTNTQVNFLRGNQIVSTANVTMNGATRFNMGTTVPGNASNTQTINNLTFNNDGGTNTLNGPTIFTGAGALTINGTLTSTNNTEVATIATINGFIALTTGNIVVDANQFNPNQVGLAINANITATGLTKTGTGYLGIGGQNHNLVGTTFSLNQGGLAFSPSTGTSNVVLGSAVVMGSATTIDTRGLAGVVGSIASTNTNAVVMNGIQGTAATLTTGLDNTNTTYAGTIQSPYVTGQLSVTKMGNGAWTLTGDNSANSPSNTLTVNAGSVVNQGKLNFQTYTLNTGGTLNLDNTTPVSNRLGGAFFTTANTLGPVARGLNMQGGNLTVGGNAGTAINEALGAVGIGGGGTITLNAAGTAGINVTLQSIGGQGQPTSLLIRGDGLGNAAGANTATLQFVTAGAAGTTPGLGVLGGGGANGTLTKSIRPDILVDPSATGTGASFLTVDTVTGLIRPLNAATEQTGNWITGTAVNTNVSLNTIAVGSATSPSSLAAGAFAANFTNALGSLTLQSGGGVNMAIIPGNNYGANGGLLTISNTVTAGILNVTGNNTITAGRYDTGGITQDFNVVAGSSLTLNAFYTNTTGMTKFGGGTLNLNVPQLSNTSTLVAINGGTVKLTGGVLPLNYFFYYTNGTNTPAGENLAVNNGTLDINGVSTVFGAITTTNPLAFAGGTAGSPNSVITNTNATFATLTTNNTNSVVSTVFSGNLNLDKAGNTTMTLSSPQTYAGTTTIRGGSIVLRDQASLVSPTINANFAELTLDNTGLSSNNARIPSSGTLNLTGGALRVNSTSAVTTQNLGTVALNGGSNLFYINQYSNNANSSSPTFNIANLAVSNSSTLNIEAPFSGGLGNFTSANAHVFISQLNGSPFSAASMVNGIIGPQYVVSNTANSFNFATYSNAAGVSIPGQNGTTGLTAATAAGAGATLNQSIGANLQAVVGQTMNSLTFTNPGAATTLAMNGTTDRLVIASGGLLISNSGNQAIAIQGGSLTAGATNTASTLYFNVGSQNTVTVNTPITNNGATLNATTGLWSGGTGPLSVVRSVGNLTLTLAPQHVETVGTVTVTTNTFTVPNSSGLFVGMGVAGTGIPASEFITGIAGNVVTITTATGVTAATNSQIAFTAPTSTATSTTTAGTSSVTTGAAAFSGGATFLPVVGQAIGGPNIAGGTTITSVSGSNAAGFTLGLSQPAIATGAANAVLTIGALSNAYTGTTTINSSTDQYAGGVTNLSGQPGAILIPGNLTINGGATVAMVTNQGQIAQTSAITINGSGVLTLVGTNRFTPTLTFNNSGGNGTPTVNVGTLLDLGNAAAITATNDNTGFTPTITGGTVNFSNATGTTINVTGASLNGLSIASQITTNTLNTTTPNAGAVITKTGAGSLLLPNANTAALAWQLNGGSIFVNANGALGTSTAAGALSMSGTVGLATAGTTGLTIALPTKFTGPTTLSLGNAHGNNQIILSGTMDLNNQNPTFFVAATSTTDSITGQITGAGGFTKDGPGALTLTPATASTFTGPVTVTGGLVTLGNANALNMATGTGTNTGVGGDVTVATAGEINLNAFAQNFGSLSGGGIVTNSGAAAALTIGSATNTTNATFSGALVAATAGNLSVIKVGTTNQTLNGQSYYTGVTTVNAGTLTLRNGSIVQTTPTLANTAITVASGATLAVRADGSNVATLNTINIGNATTTNAGASLTLSAGGNLDLRDTTINTLNVLGSGTGTALTSAATANLFFDINSTTADRVVLSRIAAITGGTINVSPITGTTSLPIGVVPLITSTAAATFTGTGTNNFTLGTSSITIGPKTYTLSLAGAQNTTTQTALNISVSTTAAYWSGAVDGFWNTGALTGVTNWRTDGSSNIDTQTPPSAVTDVVFTTATPLATNLTTTTGAAIATNSVTFSGTSNVVITDGGTAANNLTVGAGGLNVTSTAGSVTINSNLVLSAAQTWTNNGLNTFTVNGTTGGGSVSSTNTNLTVGGSGTTAISASLALGSGSLTKTGTGRVALLGASSYTGGTTVSAGLLLANNTSGSATGSGNVAVAGGSFGGYGSISGTLSITSGSVSPGDPLGNPNNSLKTTAILSVGGLSLTSGGSSLNTKINAAPNSTPTATAGNDWDAVNVTGAVALSGTVTDLPSVVGSLVVGGPNLNLILGGLYQGLTATAGDKVSLIVNDASDPIAGFFSTVGGSGLLAVSVNDPNPTAPTMFDGTDPVSGFKFTLNYADNLDGGTVFNDLSLTFTQVPEPGTLGLLGAAAVGLLARRRRRRA